MSHTPGQWRFNRNMDRYFVADSKERTIAWSALAKSNPLSEAEQISNARLIAAAPDMLEALNVAQKHLKHLSNIGASGEFALKVVNVAIAKAEGW